MPTYLQTQSLLGVDLNNTSTTQLFALGTKVAGSNNTEWVYVQAATAVTAFKCVSINATFTCGMASVTDIIGTSATSGQLGWAQNAFAASDFGWVPVRGGGLYVMMTGSSTVAAGVVPVCAGGSAVSTGMCSMVATSTGTLQGITIVAQGSGGQTASATAAQAILSWPRYSPASAA